MKAPCIVRTGLNGAIFMSSIEISTGIVDKVPDTILKCPLPSDVRQYFSTLSVDIQATGQVSYDLKNYIMRNPYCYLVFADYGNHLYVAGDKQVTVISSKTEDSAIYEWEQPPTLFNVQQMSIGFYRQPIVTYDVPPTDYQRLNIFLDSQKGIIYWDSEKFIQMTVKCDGNPKYENINYINFARNEDKSVIAVVTCDGKETYIRKT